MITNLSTAPVKCSHCTLFSETNTVYVWLKRGHPASPQTPWKLLDRTEWDYYRYFLAYLLIIVCFDDVTPTSQFTSIAEIEAGNRYSLVLGSNCRRRSLTKASTNGVVTLNAWYSRMGPYRTFVEITDSVNCDFQKFPDWRKWWYC